MANKKVKRPEFQFSGPFGVTKWSPTYGVVDSCGNCVIAYGMFLDTAKAIAYALNKAYPVRPKAAKKKTGDFYPVGVKRILDNLPEARKKVRK